MKNIFTLLLFIATTLSYAQESTLLRLNYNKGDKYEAQMSMKQNMSGGAMVMNMNIEMLVEVVDINDDVFSSEMSFKGVKMDMDQGGIKISYDSNTKEEALDDQAKMMSTQIKPMLETVLATKTNIYGEVLEMTVKEGSSGANQFGDQFSGVTYPKEAVTVGYSWTAEKESNGMTINTTYTVKSISGTDVALDLTGNITGASSTGTLTGYMNINKNSGVPSISNIKMDFEMSGQKVASEVVMEMKKV